MTLSVLSNIISAGFVVRSRVTYAFIVYHLFVFAIAYSIFVAFQNRDTIVLIRLLFHSLLCKLQANFKSFLHDALSPSWPNLFVLLDHVERFVFHTPLANKMQKMIAERGNQQYHRSTGLHYDENGKLHQFFNQISRLNLNMFMLGFFAHLCILVIFRELRRSHFGRSNHRIVIQAHFIQHAQRQHAGGFQRVSGKWSCHVQERFGEV
jgi:hypothetical protein